MEPDHLRRSWINPSVIAFAGMVEIVGDENQAASVNDGHGKSALAKSYRTKLPVANHNLESSVESIPRPRRWLFFSLTTKPAKLRSFYSGDDRWLRGSIVHDAKCQHWH